MWVALKCLAISYHIIFSKCIICLENRCYAPKVSYYATSWTVFFLSVLSSNVSHHKFRIVFFGIVKDRFYLSRTPVKASSVNQLQVTDRLSSVAVKLRVPPARCCLVSETKKKIPHFFVTGFAECKCSISQWQRVYRNSQLEKNVHLNSCLVSHWSEIFK